MGITVQNILEWRTVIIKLLSPKIHIQILQTDLHTFPHRISWENLFKDQSIFPWVIILFILINFSFYYVLILLRENWCWSLSSNVRKIPANQGFSRLCSKKNWNEASAVNLAVKSRGAQHITSTITKVFSYLWSRTKSYAPGAAGHKALLEHSLDSNVFQSSWLVMTKRMAV